MFTQFAQPFYAGVTPGYPFLARFSAPSLDAAAWMRWLDACGLKRAILLDPFGTMPQAAARLPLRGHTLLSAVNNPVADFMYQLSARPPAGADFRQALASLATERKRGQRLERHIQDLYATRCAACGREIQPQGFLWRRGEPAPYARLYRCAYCGDEGERPVEEADLQKVAEIARLHPAYYAAMLERVATRTDPDREFAEQALQHYVSRALYILSTLLNRFDVMDLPPVQKQALTALLLLAFERGTTLWAYPEPLARPRVLRTPAVFLEHNLWLAMEASLPLWQEFSSGAAVKRWPAAWQPAALHLHAGSVRDLDPETLSQIEAVTAVVPRPNQAFWTLSALWAGWLWGREATADFKHVLRRKRYDWRWHTQALQATFQHLARYLPAKTPLLACVPELEPGLSTAFLAAAESAGWTLQDMALEAESGWMQARLHIRPVRPDKVPPPDAERLRRSAEEALALPAQAVPWLWLHTAVLAAQSAQSGLAGSQDAPETVFSRWHEALPAALTDSQRLRCVPESARHPESCRWLLREPVTDRLPLDERVEKMLVAYLQKASLTDESQAREVLSAQFNGLLVPPPGLVRAVLVSYAEKKDGWLLRPEDRAAARRADLREMQAHLSALGQRLGYVVRPDEHLPRCLLWLDGERPQAIFCWRASTVLSALLQSAAGQPVPARYLVLPGSRMALLLYRRARRPWLDEALAAWQVVKFRHVRRLAAIPGLTRDGFRAHVQADPPETDDRQLALL